jgi:hypothetical protein
VPNLTIKIDTAWASVVAQERLNELSKLLAAEMNVDVQTCNVMAVTMVSSAPSAQVYMELVYRSSAERDEKFIAKVGEKLSLFMRTHVKGKIAFRGFPKNPLELIAYNLPTASTA